MEKLQIALIIGSVLYLLAIFWLLKKNKMSIRYSLLWLASGVVLLLFACFPYLAKVLRAITGVQVVSNLIFLMVIVFMLFILLSLTSAISGMMEKVKRLTQANALLEERLRRLEKDTSDPLD